MIKHLQLLELYLTNAYDLEKARPHMKAFWIRSLPVAELGIALTVVYILLFAINNPL